MNTKSDPQTLNADSVHIVLDIETTGLSRYTNKITEIAAIKLDDKKIIDKFHTLINPEQKIPKFITKLTGINNEMVKDSPKIKEVLPALKEFLGEHILVAHNAGFDVCFLNHNFKEHINHSLNNDVICTLRLSNRLPLEVENRKLGTLCNYFKIINNAEHRAMGDTEATVKLFKEFQTILKKQEIHTVEDVCKFCYKPAKTCREKIIL